MTQFSPSGEDRADRLLTIGRRLLQLIEAEITALRERRLDGASIDFEEKERLAHAYRLEITHIKADPGLLSSARPDQKHDLRELSLGLEAALSGHQVALSAMKEVSEGLVRSIAGEIAAARSGPTGYGRSGTLQSGVRPNSSGLTINAKA